MYLRSSRRAFAHWLVLTVWMTGAAGYAGSVEGGQSGAKNGEADKGKEDRQKQDSETVYTPGGDVKPPKLTHYVEPSFSHSSKEAFVEGVVKISTVVATDGSPVDLHVTAGLNSEEDRTALDAVANWRFDPGTKSGKPVKVRVTVEVDFHLL